METDKPLISIVMAVYKPDLKWIKEQLKSLNNQTYPNLELLICDDCPEFPTDEKIFSNLITNFNFKLFRNEKNSGSNKTFEKLTALAAGEYIAYCDQDDIWLPDKISKLYELITITGTQLVYSDMMIIDCEGNKIADSIKDVRKTHVFYDRDDMFSYLLAKNFVSGCTMMIKSQTAKEAMPFADNMVHDHWLALCASRKGKIKRFGEPLIYYRIHGKNQTDFLKDSEKKNEYIHERIDKYLIRMKEISERFPDNTDVERQLKWAECREAYSHHKKGMLLKLWKLRKCNKNTTIFELLALPLPDALFKKTIKLIKKMNYK